MNIGRIIQKTALIFLMGVIMTFLFILLVECENPDVWNFGSLGALVIIELAILAGGLLLSALLYGFGEIIICLQDIRDLVNSI